MADILISPASTMPNAPTGEVTLFINTENNNILSYITDTGEVRIYNYGAAGQADLEECCSCIIAKQWMDSVTCALNSGILTATEFGTIINAGLTVTSTEVIDSVTGAKTCTVNVGPKQVNPVAVTEIDVAPAASGPATVSIGGTRQLSAVVLPSNATTQAVLWISGNTAKATVNASGLVMGMSAGTVVIYAYSQSNPSVYGQIVLTVS